MKPASVSLKEPQVAAPPAQAPAVLVGHEPAVDRLVELTANAAEIEDEIKRLRVELDRAVDELRILNEQDTGHACKSIQARGSETNAKYCFADRYKVLDVASGTALEKLLGKKFKALFVEHQLIDLKDGAGRRLLELLEQLGRADEFLEVERCFKPVDEFREARALQRAAMSKSQNQTLDRVVTQIAARPSASFK